MKKPTYIIYGNEKSKTKIVLIGGSGDDEHSFHPLVTKLIACFPHFAFVTFSFSNTVNNLDLPLHSQVDDLRFVLRNVTKSSDEQFILIATSQGAYSLAHILSEKHVSTHIQECILLDPADYYTDNTIPISQAHSWSGFETYKPDRLTASMKMKEMVGNSKINVVHFTLRNHDKNGYGSIEQRGVDNPNKFSRLNSDMVRSFYENTPEANRGSYITENTLPHAFMRDGEVVENINKLTNLICSLVQAK